MKKIYCLAIILIFLLSACGSGSEEPAASDAAPSEEVFEEATDVTEESGEGSEEAGSEASESADVPDAEEANAFERYSVDELMADLVPFRKDNLIAYVPKAFGPYIDDDPNVPENQLCVTSSYMGMILGKTKAGEDGPVPGGSLEALMNDQERLVRTLLATGTVDETNGRYYTYELKPFDDGNCVDIWTALADSDGVYLIMIRCSEENWLEHKDLFLNLVEKLEISE